jgi:superfamily I DNA/RNA helicase
MALTETAYAWETRGPHRRQARENLKKLRSMVTRFENRGFATLARVAAHLDRLAVGDESNAAIDAVDAVSLMTVHAAKGLEFPVVFVVNMNRGTGNMRAPIRIAPGTAGEPSVAIADYQSEADEDAAGREREETKRLLYVALTRARDRLYLSATVRGGVCRPTRGSLGEVLPAEMSRLFEAAAAADGRRVLEWTGADGRAHRFGAARDHQ